MGLHYCKVDEYSMRVQSIKLLGSEFWRRMAN